MEFKIKVYKNGAITIPKFFRDKYNFSLGDSLIFKSTKRGIKVTKAKFLSKT